MSNPPDLIPSPNKILQLSLSFIPTKAILLATKLDLFTFIASKGHVTCEEVKSHFAWECSSRNVFDFLDLLVSVEVLKREGLLETSIYSNSDDSEYFLDKAKKTYVGGMLTMANNRLYGFFDHLEDGLKTGKPQNEIKDGINLFESLYKNHEKLQEFTKAMSSFQKIAFDSLAAKYDFSKYQTLSDIGGSGATLSTSIAKLHSSIKCTSYDLPEIQGIAKEILASQGMETIVSTGVLDFFKDDFPKSDVITMGNILHDWDEPTKEMLIKKSFDALPEGGIFIAIENIIDDDRRKNVAGLSTSLVMLIETGTGFDYTISDFNKWATIIGFKKVEFLNLTNSVSAAIAYK